MPDNEQDTSKEDSMTRTDVHRPAELVTEDYTYRFARDLQSPTISREGNPLPIHEQLRLLFGHHDYWSGHNHGNCDHCGAAIRYAAYLVHNPTGDVITVGETCLDNRFERSTTEFQALRKTAELDRQAQRLVQAERTWLREHLDMAWIADLKETDHYILHDMRRKLRQYSSLSPKQVEFAKKLLREQEERELATEPAKVKIPDSVNGQRMSFVGTVLSAKWYDNDFGGSFKALVKVEHGDGYYTLFGSVPSAEPGNSESLKGETVSWVATVERARNDDTHGYFKRPRMAKS